MLGSEVRLISSVERTLLPSIGNDDDIVEAVAFLVSDAVRVANAQVLAVDGVWSV